jgi:hypothetical protein
MIKYALSAANDFSLLAIAGIFLAGIGILYFIDFAIKIVKNQKRSRED